MYGDCDYRGSNKLLSPGTYGDDDLGIGNDQLSSIRIPRGYKVTLYKDNGLRGESIVLTSDQRCLNGHWDNSVSSVRVDWIGR